MTPLFKKIAEANAAIKAHEVDDTNKIKIKIVESAAIKISAVLATKLSNAKLHTTTRRLIERESKLQDALFFALEKVLEVKTYAHYLKREDLEKLKNTKVTITEINEVLEKLNTALVVDHGLLDNKLLKLEEKMKENGGLNKKDLNDLKEYNSEKILMSQLQEIVATYLATLENNYNV